MIDAAKLTDDELLSAFMDGELPADAATTLEARLEREPELAARLEMLQAGNDEARRLFAVLDDAPMPQSVLDQIATHREQSAADNVIAFPTRGFRRLFEAPVAIAASVALVAGFLIGGLYRGDVGTETPAMLTAGVVADGSRIHDLLESGLSGEDVALGSGVNGRILLTFEDINGDYCRQLSAVGDATQVHGLACRRGERWQIEATGLADAAPTGQFVQASGTTPAAIDAATDRLMGSAPALDTDEESSIISNSWKKSGD